MRAPLRAGITVLALTCGSLLGVVPPAHAADPVVWYVRQLSTACSDSGSGTPEQPFCTIGRAAAVVAEGQSVEIGSGNYRERVTVTTSGTTFQAAPSATVTLIGTTAGVAIDGLHDVTLRGLRVNGAAGATLPALDVRGAAAITVEGGSFAMLDARSPVSAVRLAGVTGALLSGASVGGEITVDATSSAVTINHASVRGVTYDPGFPSVGIRIGGRGHRVLNNWIDGYAGAAVAVEPDAVDTVVANNQIFRGPGVGIHNRGGSGTAIANNTIRERCRDGIRVDGASTGVSVQNNVLLVNGGSAFNGCGYAGSEIGIHDGAVGRTTVDYNNVDHYSANSSSLYGWNGTPMGLAAFRAASGQAGHDIETGVLMAAVDSGNSAAPGYQPTDRLGQARIDDLGIADTGAGPVRYADRGASETYSGPRPRSTFTVDLVARTVTVNASTSVPGVAPIASYSFDFGDGTFVTQASPIATHRYANPGEYTISTAVTGSDNRGTSTEEVVSVLRATTTMGLLSLSNLRYVATAAGGTALAPTQAALTADGNRTAVGVWERFDLVDLGNGQVALFARANNRFVVAESAGTKPLIANRWAVGAWERFVLIRNSDGTVSLRAAVNNRYVCAESAGAKPLIANRWAIGPWEKFVLG